MAQNNYKFLDAKIEFREDELKFEKGLIQKFNQLSRRTSTPKRIKLENISSCFVRDEGNAAHKPELVIKHNRGSEEIKCNKGIAHKLTSILGFDGIKGAEEIAKRFDNENQEDKLMKDL